MLLLVLLDIAVYWSVYMCVCNNLFYFILFYFIHFIITFGKFGPPYLGKTTAAARTVLPNPTSACWVFSRFHNPLNSDMDYRIFNMRT